MHRDRHAWEDRTPALSFHALSEVSPLELDRIICGDCQQVLPTLPDKSIDLLLTDPPYGISFMGQDWDRAVPSVGVWRECLRVLKPGAFAFVMCIPRQDCLARMICNLGEAGFNAGYSPILHAFASGFAKAENVSLVVDKRACADELTGKLGRKPTREEFQEAWKTYRKVVGRYELPEGGEWNLEQANDPTIEHSKPTFTASGTRTLDIRAPTSTNAKALSGSYGGFQPKPAWEAVLVVMRPLSEKTFVDQALKNRKGITWLDQNRIPFQSETETEQAHYNALGPVERFKTHKMIYEGVKESAGFPDTWKPEGRFPANLLVSSDILNDGKMKQTRSVRPGSFSRFFSLDAWWERKVRDLPEAVQRTFPFLVVAKASKSERNRGLDELPLSQTTGGGGLTPIGHAYGSVKPVQQNPHPTVKPIKLMNYLVTLGSRPGDLILDPFCGTGSTCIASLLYPPGQERHYLGIEIDRQYCGIAEKRLACWRRTVRGLCGPVVILRLLQAVFRKLRTAGVMRLLQAVLTRVEES
jgi:site-specific DNA-methyltransferase (adenine-specific)